MKIELRYVIAADEYASIPYSIAGLMSMMYSLMRVGLSDPQVEWDSFLNRFSDLFSLHLRLVICGLQVRLLSSWIPRNLVESTHLIGLLLRVSRGAILGQWCFLQKCIETVFASEKIKPVF